MKKQRSGWQVYQSKPLVFRIGIAFILGSLAGLVFGEKISFIAPLGSLFIKLLKMIIIPIVFLTLVGAMRRLTPSKLGLVGIQTVALYLITTAIAIIIGLITANLISPGIGLELPLSAEIMSKDAPSLTNVLLGIVPQNPVQALAEGNVLQTIFVAIVFGLALAVLQETAAGDIKAGISSIFNIVEAGTEAMFKIVWGVMEFGVLGVFALMASVFAETGLQALLPFAKLIFSLLLAVIIQISITYLLVIVVGFLKQRPLAFVSGVKDAMLTALSIRSSSGTLPVSMANAEDNLQIDEEIYSFTLPLGATINMDGTAMYQGVAAVFAANLIGQTLTLSQQLTIIVTAVLASIGTAGVPGSGLIMLTMVLTQLGLPLSVVGFVAGIDPILDRLRTINNVTGDLAVTALVAKWNDAIDFTKGSWSTRKK